MPPLAMLHSVLLAAPVKCRSRTGGASGLPVAQGVVRWFDIKAGSGLIARDDGCEDVFFNFTAIPGEGYRTLPAGTPVKFEIVENKFGLSARNSTLR